MILGIGIDIIEIERVNRAIGSARFWEKVYTPQEREFLNFRNRNPCSVAGNFAAKEAMVKALAAGFGIVKWTDIEVLRDSKGAPYVLLHGKALEIFEEMGGQRIWISISHSKKYAVAQVIIEGGRHGYVCGDAVSGKSH